MLKYIKYFLLLNILGLHLFNPVFSQSTENFEMGSLESQLDEELTEDFPVKGSLVERVKFWIRVYTEIKTTQAFLHDDEDLSIIYKQVNLPKGRRTRNRFLRSEKNNYRKILRSIAKKGGQNLNSKEQEVYKIVGHKKISEIKSMANNLRFQYGLKDRYYTGLIRSYEYLDYIKKIFAKYNLPDELVYLPHVESSFNYNAYSKVGAAGIWQFMRSTGRMYKLKVNYVVDERRDVFKATEAAAKLLKDNYRKLHSWPLALTAYNHGARSMQRAVNKLGTTDIHKIIDSYEGRRFGFASKNFYATFMATVILSRNPEKYFKEFKLPRPFTFSQLTLKRPYTVAQLSKTLGFSSAVIGQYNPSIRRSALKSPLALPKNFKLNIPLRGIEEVAKLQAKVDDIKAYKRNFNLERLHIISRGENLFEIAQAYKVSMNDLIAFNQISNPSRIYAGMKLKIPGKNSQVKKIIPNIDPNPVIKKEETKVVISATKKEVGPEPLPDTVAIPSGEASLESYDLSVTPLKAKNLYKIVVETDETLGHYADWANIKTQNIRNWNGISQRSLIRQGQGIKLFLTSEELNAFKQKRNQYHLSIQEDFYSTYKVSGSNIYTIKRGDTISGILKKFDLPYWLLRQNQADSTLSASLRLGQELKIPLTESLEDAPTVNLLESTDGD